MRAQFIPRREKVRQELLVPAQCIPRLGAETACTAGAGAMYFSSDANAADETAGAGALYPPVLPFLLVGR